MSLSIRDRIFGGVLKMGECWIYSGHIDREGYGRVRRTDGNQYAHRIAYELEVGPIPAGMVIDHVRARGCRHRSCVNPAHLEPVTIGTNVLRGDGWPAQNARRETCRRGHQLTTTRRQRVCQTCRRERERRNRLDAKHGTGCPTTAGRVA